MLRPASRPALALILALAAVTAARPAAAATRYVSPGGSDSNSGASAALAWRTIAKANASAQPGDVILVANGTYADFPNPAVSGSPGNRIAYVGNLSSPGSVVITPGGTISDNDVTIKGFRLASGFSMAGTRDSLADCEVLGGRSDVSAANDCALARLNVNAQRFWMFGSETDTIPQAQRDTIRDCVFNLSSNDPNGHTVRFKAITACVFERNRWNIVVGPASVGSSATKLFTVRHCRFIDSHWDITNNCTGASDEAGWFMQRDYTQSNTWVRDTIEMGGAGEVQFFGSGSGSWPGTVMNNSYDGLVVKLYGTPSYGAAMFYQDQAQWETLRNCVFVGSRSGLVFNVGLWGPLLVDHCTSVGFSPDFGAAGMDAGGTTVWGGTSVFHSNLFATASVAPRDVGSASFYVPVNIARGHLSGNWNVYSGPMVRDSSIFMAGGGGVSAPGVGKPWCVASGADSNSVFGAAQFVNATGVRAFDAHLTAGSAAIGAGVGGSDAGAYPVNATAETQPPLAIGNLVVVSTSPSTMTLQWAAPADAPTGGLVSAYDVRMSTSAITDLGTFGAATAVSGAPAPGAPGAFQSVSVSGLNSGTQYWYAVRSRDAAGNWSPLSNVVVQTAGVDVIPPAVINDLGAGP